MSDFYIAVGANPVATGSLNIHNGTTYTILDGTLDLSTPGRIAFTQVVRATTADARIAAADTLFRLIRSAAQAESIGSSITFTLRRGGTAYTHYDLTGFTIDPELTVRLHSGGTLAEYDIALTCYPYSRGDAVTVASAASAGTLAGSTAAFLVQNITGHMDALAHLELTDTSAAGVINRVRASVIRGDFTAATNYTAWLNAAALAGATDTADATALGGTYAARTLTSTTHVDIARAVQPAGTRQQGRMDGYARVYSTATAIGVPGSLATSVTAPEASTVDSSQYAAPIASQITGWTISTPSTPVATLNNVQAGSLLVAVVKIQDPSGIFDTGTTPAGYTRVAVIGAVDATAYVQYVIYQRRNVSSGTHNVSFSTLSPLSASYPYAGLLMEIPNGDAIIGYTSEFLNVTTDEPTQIVAVTETSFTNEMILAFAGSKGTTGATPDFWYAGYEAFGWINGLLAASRIVAAEGSIPLPPRVRSTTTPTGWRTLALNIKPQRSSSSVTTYAEPTPGELAIGTYTARIQAIDAAGYRGNASGSVAGSVTTARSAIAWSWTAATNATAYALTIQNGSRFYEVITTGTSYDLNTLDGLKEVSALPATSGATAPPPRIRARVGTLNDLTMTVLPEVPLSGSGAYEIVRLFNNRMLPPLDAPLADTWPDYAVEVQGRSANGVSAALRVDALWVVPCREPQVEAWIQGLAHATKRRWVLESHRAGKGAFGWLENTVDGAEVGRITTAGSLLIPAGTSIVLLEFEQVAGVHSLTAQVTATLSVWPRHRWGS